MTTYVCLHFEKKTYISEQKRQYCAVVMIYN